MKGLLQKTPKVVLFLATNEKAGRDKLQGILRFVRLHTPWNIHLIENRIGEQQLGNLQKWGANGIIVARMPESIGTVARARVPTVVLDSPALYAERLPQASYVTSDSAAIGRSAAAAFLKQGFNDFAYVADTVDWDWSIQRGAAFCERVRTAGGTCAVYAGLSAKERNDWSLDQKRLARWLRGLPHPTAVLAAWDGRARQVLETCQAAGLRVPMDIALMGVDNEEVLCENTSPSLSSIQPDFEEGGYRAAELLEQLMRRNVRNPQTHLYGVRQIVLRESSRSAAAADRRLLSGLEFIRLNAGEPIRVSDVACHMGVSRRLAEGLFRKHLAHSILDEIQQIRLSRLKTFLLETVLPLGHISGLCGYQTEMHAKRVFKQHEGMTMSQFREGGSGRRDKVKK
jgi:LacI family transcriptional regulator